MAIARRGGYNGFCGLSAFGTPTSTFLYTTVFAAGLAIDAKAKAARNKQWEGAFAQLREELNRPRAKERTRDGAKDMEAVSKHIHHHHDHHWVPLDDLPNDLDWDAMHRAVGMELADDYIQQGPGALAQWAEYQGESWDALGFDSSLPGAQSLEWPVNTGRYLRVYNLPPQSLWAPESMRLTAMRRRHTWKKLAMQELSTGLLIHTLVSRANLPKYSKYLQSADSDLDKISPQLFEVAWFTQPQAMQARRELLENIEKLHETDVNSPLEVIVEAGKPVNQPAIPSYFQDADGDFHGICQQMNKGIKQLLRQTSKGNERKEALAIAKICHNLLVSTAAPDLQTYNLLLSGFKLWQRPNLVDDVIAASYVHKIRHNEITCREILGHYISESRPDDFSRFVAKMRGVGDALMLADPKITINEASQGRLVRVSQDKVFQKVHPTPMVFSALIGGVKKFAGFDRALDIYYEMKADGWGLDVQGLTKLLGDCIRRADWQGGIYLWEEINGIKAYAKPQDMMKAYYHMLSLCSITGNTVAFNHILNEVARRGFDRRDIINAAERITYWTQKEREYRAPAWVADNVLIAVSGYINDAKKVPKGEAEYESFVDGDAELESLFEAQSTEQTRPVDQDPVDQKEAWASWVEHEFGERPKDPEP